MIKTHAHRLFAAACLVLTGMFLLSSCSRRGGSAQAANALKAPGQTILAEVNGRQITQQEIDDQIGSPIYTLEDKAYQMRKAALNRLIVNMLVEEEARKGGTSVEEVKRRHGAPAAEVPDEQVNQIYSIQSARFTNLSEDEAKRQIKAALTARSQNSWYEKYLGELNASGAVSVLLQPPPLPRVNVKADGPSKGSADAQLLLVEFSDFQCPACKQASSVVRQLVADYGDRLRVVYKHMPLGIHKDAFGAAQAAVCAGEQGKFWEMHDLLFASNSLAEPALESDAAKLGLDADRFTQCMASEESRAVVQQDIKEAQSAGISGTPSFVLNGRLIKGGKRIEDFRALLDEELRRAAAGDNSRQAESALFVR